MKDVYFAAGHPLLLISNIFLLPEVGCVKIRNVIIKNDVFCGEKLQEAMNESYHDCYSDVDLAILVTLSPKDTITPIGYMERIDRFGINTENCLGLLFVEENKMYRMVLKNGMRYDFGFELYEQIKIG